MTPRYTVRAARPEDPPRLPAIELAAARMLAGHAPESVLTETTRLEVLENAQREGRLWVACADGVPVGFAHVEVIERDRAHLEEIDVPASDIPSRRTTARGSDDDRIGIVT